ncbi:MAG: arsenite methyltransferase [Deltaproteobacteria bacterium]|nr:arsenite methyltransferase [Deltaproteobacteria bacterium]
MDEGTIRKSVRDRYAGIARQGGSCCGPAACCEGTALAKDVSKKIGYSEEELKSVPQGANLGLGCGNPIALASLSEGETVLDLGSGAGFDCFLAARQVGPRGKVVGVDMTPEMIEKARENARKGDIENVEFRLGEIENLPVADGSVDVILSNCVINLSPAKEKVFAEAFRALRPGGRAMISDIMLSKELPEPIRSSIAAYTGCVAGAVLKKEYLRLLETAGFREIRILEETTFSVDESEMDSYVRAIAGNVHLPMDAVREAAASVTSVRIYGVKPPAGAADPSCSRSSPL